MSVFSIRQGTVCRCAAPTISCRCDIYCKNSTVKDVELRFSTGDRLETTLKDDPAPQHVALSRPIQAKWVQLIVRSVYPGWKYSDTAINEVRVDVQ